MKNNYFFYFKNQLLLFFAAILISGTTLGQDANKTTIFWDTSTSRMERDSKMELEYLEAYFQRFSNIEVTLIGFSNAVHFKEEYNIENGNWSILKEKIESVSYDGATSFYGLESYSDDGYNLVFTDGFQNAGKTVPRFKGKTVVVNSSKNYDKRTMNLFSIVGKAEFLDLLKKKEDTKEKKTPAVVQKQPTKDSVIPGIRSGLQLDEVVVTENIENTEKLESTALGPKSNDAVGYAVQSIGSDKIKDAVTTLNTGLQGKFSNVSLGQNDDLSQVTMRQSNSLLGNNYGLIV